MSFISTGSYPDSPGLSIRAGVYYCQQAIAPQSGYLNNLGGLALNNAKVCGSYDYDNFECGYLNFDSGFSGYNVDYHRLNGYQLAKDAVTGLENFSTALVLSGYPVSFNQDRQLIMPNSGALTTGNITIYGRFKTSKRIENNDSPIVSFGQLGNPFSSLKLNGIILQGQGGFNKTRFVIRGTQGASDYYTLVDGTIDTTYTSSPQFYNFLFTLNSSQTAKLYESTDSRSLSLTNVYQEGSALQTYEKWQGPIYLMPTIEDCSIVWTDLGISNRAWTPTEVEAFNTKRVRPGLFIYENPNTVIPSPSGDDTTYLNFHFNGYTSGNCGLLSTTKYDDTSYYIDLDCNISSGIYEFERSEYNNKAIKVDLWARSNSSNPSGYVNANIAFLQNDNGAAYVWSGYPAQVAQNDFSLVTISGKIFDLNGNPVDTDQLSISSFQRYFSFLGSNYKSTASLGLGAWYRDIGTTYSGDINIYSARVYVDAWCTIPSTGNSLTLYTSGQYKSMESLDLFLQQSTADNNTDLFIQGVGLTNNSTDLFIAGGFRFDSTTLYIGGLDTANSGCSLYMDGGIQKATMPLHIYSAPPSQMSGNIPLSIWATTYSGTSNGISLFVGESAPSGVKTAGMNLYVKGPESARITAGMNLFLKREAYAENNSLTLYCANEFTGASGNLTLYMSAPSGTLGAIPVSGSMNLFINRSVESVDGGMTMYTSGPQSAQQAVEMYINGGTPYFSSIPLSIDGIGVKNNAVKFYTHGF